jgi:iron complex outermembrane recepter protein
MLRSAFILLLLVSELCAQQITGVIRDEKGAPLPFAPVALLDAADNAIVKGEITDENGTFTLTPILHGTYLVSVRFPGYLKYVSEPVVLDSLKSLTIPDVKLETEGLSLEEVSVTALKRTVEFKQGNITVNLEDSPLAVGNSAYDILQRMPGVSINNNEISIQGRSGTRIMLDGKLEQLAGVQLINLLKSIRASSIEKIEIFKNPPVKFDAAGSGGMINLDTRKVKVRGFSGDLNTDISQGYYTVNNQALSLNYKGKKINLFTGFTRCYEEYHFTDNSQYRTTIGNQTSVLEQALFIYEQETYYPVNAGFDWFPDKKNSIGVKASVLIGNGTENWNGTTRISNNDLGYNGLTWHSTQPNPWSYNDLNLNAEHLFDTVGTKLKFSADYTSWFDIYDFNYDNRYLTGDRETLPPQIIKTRNHLNLQVLSAKLDFEKKLGKNTSLEAGIKIANQDISSKYNLGRLNNVSGEYENDSLFTNKYRYLETIAAAYISVSGKLGKKWNYSAGLRTENTDVLASSATPGLGYNRTYLNFFPAFNLEYNPSEDHQFSFSANRRINRPDYNSLNPFQIFQNTFLSWSGNATLFPDYNNSIELSHTYDESISNSLSFSYVENFISPVFIMNDTTRTTREMPVNLRDKRHLAYSFFLEMPLGKRVNTTAKVDASWVVYRGSIRDEDYSSSRFGWSAALDNIFLIAKNTKLEVNAYYEGPWLNGLVLYRGHGFVDVGIKRSFLSDKLKVGFAVKDVFFSFFSGMTFEYQGQKVTTYDTYDTRRFNLTVSYNFGKLKVQQRQLISNEEEKERQGGK